MKFAVMIALLVLLFPAKSNSEELQSYVDENGRTVWVNAGQTQEAVKLRNETEYKEKLNSLAAEIIAKYPELKTDEKLLKKFIELKDGYISQGKSIENSLFMAEKDMLSQGYISEPKPPELSQQQMTVVQNNSRGVIGKSYEAELKRKKDTEMRMLDQYYDTEKKNCMNRRHGSIECQWALDKKIKEMVLKLHNDPEMYFEEKEIAKEEEKEKRADERKPVVNVQIN